MLDDIRLAIKQLRRSPLFVTVAVVTLGLGIGLTSTMLTMLDAVVHPYVPYRDVQRIYSVHIWGDGRSGQVSLYDKYVALREGTQSFEQVSAGAFGGMALAEAYGTAATPMTLRVSGNYFSLLGLKPEAGRFFTDGPSGPDENKAVIGFHFWKNALASRPLDRGIHITLDGRDYDVIGIMPPEVGWPLTDVVLRTAGFAGETPQQRRALFPVARLKAGVTEAAAYAELKGIAERLTAMYGEGRQKFQFRLNTWNLRPDAITDFQFAMGGAAVGILLIICANLANLMLVRGLARRPELALRLALGASRRDLVRQLFTESALVGALGGAVGMLLAVWGVDLVRHRLPLEGRFIGALMPYLDWRVFAFAAGTTLLAVLFFGLGPALTASDVSVAEPLKHGAGTTSGGPRRRYSVLVVAQVGICLVLLMGAGLMLRMLDLYDAYDPGFERKGLLEGTVNLGRLKSVPDQLMQRTFADVRSRLEKVPGVLGIAVTGNGPTQQGAITSDLEGAEPRFMVARTYHIVSREYVSVMGYRLIRGRDFAEGDQVGPPVGIVDEHFGERMWPGQDPVGRMVKLGGPSSRAPWVRIVGLIRGQRLVSRQGEIGRSGQFFVLDPRDQSRSRWITARVSGNSAVVGMRMRRAVEGMFPVGQWSGGAFRDYAEMDRQMATSYSFITRLFSTLGLLGLFLAAVGMYGVLAYAVGQRMREFGIRIALGARSESVFRMVMHDAALMILAGTAIGCWFAMWAGQLIVGNDAVIPPTDWVALVLSEAMLITVCFAACLTPAIRASKANPLDIIRAI